MAKKQVDMSAHFTSWALLRYALPSIAMCIFTSLYGIVDGLFVSNFAGATAFAAVNFIMPVIMVLSTVGFMLGAGGSAVVSMMRGKGEHDQANRTFSLLVYVTFGVGVVLAVLGFALCPWISEAMGASGQMLEDASVYGRIIFLSLPGYVLQTAFQILMTTAGKPKLGLGITVASGLANIVLDFVLVAALNMGYVGAALATNASEWLGGLAPVVYFACKNSSFFRLGRTRLDLKLLGKICVNGSSEMMAVVAVSVVSIVYNIQLLALTGETGVAAYGVIMFVYYIFSAVFEGYSMAASPLVSFQHGARQPAEVRSLLVKSLRIVGIASAGVFLVCQLLAFPLSYAFCSYDAQLCAYTEHAFRIFYLCFLFAGFNIFGSAFFTALGNGLVSAGISFVRTIVLETAAVLLLPLLFGTESLWFACAIAEVLAFGIVVACLLFFGPVYGYRMPREKRA
ncbi:MAG: MATE family efflux transporter [Coriobacteriia bacterium]|nr:MATE family efflux transporter [Coriobacteriia bacterium]